jgi:hypothetical protein
MRSNADIALSSPQMRSPAKTALKRPHPNMKLSPATSPRNWDFRPRERTRDRSSRAPPFNFGESQVSNDNEDELCETLKALSALHSMLCYARRELSSMSEPCEEAEQAMESALTAIRARIAATKAKAASVEAANEPIILLN